MKRMLENRVMLVGLFGLGFLVIILFSLIILGPQRVVNSLERRITEYFDLNPAGSVHVPTQKLVGDAITEDPFSGYQWGLRMMLNGETYWDLQADAPKDVVVAVIDRGVHTEHEELTSRAVEGFNFENESSDLLVRNDEEAPNASISHGLCSASIIAAEVDNEIGIAGVFHRARIMPLQSNGQIGKAINYAVTNGADVILVAGGGGADGGFLWPMYGNPESLPDSTLYNEKNLASIKSIKEALRNAYRNNIPVVTGVGNTQSFGMTLLADDETTIAVAPHNVFGEVSEHTSFSYSFDVFAPGGSRKVIANSDQLEEMFPDQLRVYGPHADFDDPLCAVGNSGYSFLTLGSAAMPHVAGTVAFIKSYLPKATVDEVREILRKGSVPLDPSHSLLEGLGGRISLPKIREAIDNEIAGRN